MSAPSLPLVRIESLDQEGRGLAHVEGKAVFVEGALPGELVGLSTLKRKPTYEIARAETIVEPSASRVAPRCPHFGTCGGCALQHADGALQLAAKQRVLEDALARIGRVSPGTILAAVQGPAWGYRLRARLSVRNVRKKGGVLVGFHERKSSFVADMLECPVLPPAISNLLPALRQLVGSLSICDRLPQIEVAVGDRVPPTQESKGLEPVHALVLRVLEPPSFDDERALRAFAERHDVELWLQSGGPATVVAFHPPHASLSYSLPDFDLRLAFSPTEFTQVNHAVNRVLVRRAIALLDPQRGERVVDFFCGLGNFSLPIARRGAEVLGIEGSEALVRRARANTAANGLESTARFEVADLFTARAERVAAWMPFEKALIDPPREGAVELVKSLPNAGEVAGLRRVVYVSCNPGTLARDAAVLVNDRGYRLAAAGVINMFPHTGHVESIAVFDGNRT